MKTSLNGMFAIMRHEGIVLSRYKDAVGVWTIGVGHTAAAGTPDPKDIDWKLSFAEVRHILQRDLRKFEARVNKAIKVPLEQHEFDALVSFDFNTGGIHRATATRLINAGQKREGADALLNWTRAGGRELPALVTRRKEERAVFTRAAYPDPFATIYPATPEGKVEWSKGKRVDLRTLVQGPTPPPKEKPKTPEEPPKSKGGLFSAIIALFAKLFRRTS